MPEHPYIEILEDLTLNTSTSMEPRCISTLQSREGFKKDLVVLEVQLDLPRVRLEKPMTREDRAAMEDAKIAHSAQHGRKGKKGAKQQQQQSENKNSSGASSGAAYSISGDEGLGGRRYVANLHRIVGCFSSLEEKEPSGLDMGLYEWEDIQRQAADVFFQRIDSAPTLRISRTLTEDSMDSVGVLRVERSTNGKTVFFMIRGRALRGKVLLSS